MKPLQRKYRLHEKVLLEVLDKAEWHKIHWKVESHVKWGVINPTSHTIFVMLSDTIDNMHKRKDEQL